METIKTLNKEELRNFKLYLRRIYLNKTNAPIQILADAYKSGKLQSDEEIHKKHFSHLKKNAFYRLKNRMNEEINKSLLLMHFDKDDATHILNNLNIAKVFIYKSEYEKANKILVRIEKKAWQNELYFYLGIIYDEFLNLSKAYDKIPVLEILEKKRSLQDILNKANETADLIAEISWRLKKSNYSQKGINIIEELETINKALKHNEKLLESNNIKIQIQETVRNILLQKGDYNSLSIFLNEKLTEFKKDKVFNNSNHRSKIIMQSWLINSHIMMSEFDVVLKLSDELYKSICAYKKLHYDNFIWTYYQSVILACYYTNQLEKALNLLEELKKEKAIINHSSYRLFSSINNAAILFSMNKINEAHFAIAEIQLPETLKSFSKPIQLTIEILDIIFYYEKNDIQFLKYKLKEVKKKYRNQLSEDLYKREFLNIIQKLCNNNKPFTKAKIVNIVNEFANKTSVQINPNSNAINYRIWLKSKQKKTGYYQLLLDNSLSE